MIISKLNTAFNLAMWFLSRRYKGVPIERFNDLKYNRWFENYRDSLLKYKDIHKGEDCFIIGNGPSLNSMDLQVLNDYYTFGLNKIHLLFEKQKIDLSYHVAVNPLVIKQILQDVEDDKFGCPSFFSFTHESIKIINKNIEILFTNDGAEWVFSSSILKPIFEGYTVTFVAMQIAFFMGFTRVFLIGVDHNFVQFGNPNEEQIMEGPDINHFHPNYFSGQRWNLADMRGSELSYRIAKYAYESDNRRIFDSTFKGKLDVFEKLPFDAAIQAAKKRK